MGLDIGADQMRIAQHGLPIVVLQPSVIVDTHAAELFDAFLFLAGAGRDRHWFSKRKTPAPRGKTPACGESDTPPDHGNIIEIHSAIIAGRSWPSTSIVHSRVICAPPPRSSTPTTFDFTRTFDPTGTIEVNRTLLRP